MKTLFTTILLIVPATLILWSLWGWIFWKLLLSFICCTLVGAGFFYAIVLSDERK